MKHAEFLENVRSLVASLAVADPDQNWSSVTHLLDYGQEDEAMDVLVATVVRFNVPVSTAQREMTRLLMAEFDFTDESRWHYRYLADPEMLDRMTVVDETS